MPFFAILGLGYLTIKNSIKLLSAYSAIAIIVNLGACLKGISRDWVTLSAYENLHANTA